MDIFKYKNVLYTLSLGAIGGVLAFYLGLPAPFLMGPAVAVTIGCLLGLELQIPPILRDICFVFIGLSMGSGATPAVIEAAKKWPISFVILGVFIYLIMFFGARVFVKSFAFKPATALLASTPGHLSFVIALSEDVGADTQKIALVQSIRILALTLLIPFVLMAMDLTLPKINFVQKVMDYQWIVLLALGAAIIGYILKKLKIPAAYLIAGMIISTVTHITSMVEGMIPQATIIPAFIIMGCLIGTRFNGARMQTIKAVLWPAIVFFIVALSISTLGAVIVYFVTGVPFAQILIAFAPGGVEAMIAMALLLNADPTFVAAHHIMRLFILAALLPWLMKRIQY